MTDVLEQQQREEQPADSPSAPAPAPEPEPTVERMARADWFQQTVENVARNTAAYQRRATLLNELEAMINVDGRMPKKAEAYRLNAEKCLELAQTFND